MVDSVKVVTRDGNGSRREKTVKLRDAHKILKGNTMACWWPSKRMGREGTDWTGIIDEVDCLLRDIKRRQDIDEDARFFTLNPGNPESILYDELVQAVQTFRSAAYS
jgi:hypothetical protein